MAKTRSSLAIKVECVNRVHRVANKICSKLNQKLQSFVGKEVVHPDGPLHAKFQAFLDKCLRHSSQSQVTLHFTKTSISFKVKGFGENCSYEVNVPLGKLYNGVFLEIDTFPELKEDYSPSTIVKQAKSLRKTEKLLKQKQQELQIFIEAP